MASVLIAGADPGGLAGLLEQAGHTVRLAPLDAAPGEPVAGEPDELDVLINTAGLAPETFEAKVAGLARALQAHLPALERSAAPVVVNVSDPGSPLSEAAARVVAVEYAKAFPGVRISTAGEDAESIVRVVGREP
ncbi:hypothetical protein V1227_38340 [Lentzea sp. DG1S-22]|uniref:hypothetical protein n=1 Tax=Lentzea sp. DG1S-22 TaxID=3108822 RepID=UPI002E79838F|nr:hypothetical protein [Lentzea sp. DG1S-22]WVH80777.1 hypothetical protein V1227_38340 [Lentzea sp. DG1S-22]